MLIIEDNVDAADTLQEVLALDGHQVAVAYGGDEGLKKSRELEPDIILCDIGLPGMDGYQVARAVRAERASHQTLLVALSGYALPGDLERARAAGFDRHVAKPPSLELLRKIFTESLVAR